METAKDAGRRISLSGMLKKLGVSRSGYQAFLKRGPSVSQIRKERVKQRILELYNDSNQNYGAPKIARLLQKEGERVSERTVGLYMRELKIRAQWTKPWIATTTGSDFSVEFRNILDMQFNPDHPNAVWCTDITYIWRRQTDQPLILHSDRGTQFVSEAYWKATEKFQLSYSRKGYPYDNACIESFHSLIKREWLNRFRIRNRSQAYRLVFEYIEAFYNTIRIHSHCDYMSPDQFERLYRKVVA